MIQQMHHNLEQGKDPDFLWPTHLKGFLIWPAILKSVSHQRRGVFRFVSSVKMPFRLPISDKVANNPRPLG